ncbi:MAG: acyl-CoA thioesterase [Bacteroidales bacterium]|jgi:acyl-CoA thioester hydrolase|nr:acyl-CoA thioesterase [Bacteroidales bacterium]
MKEENIQKKLSETTKINIHFYDVDSINMVWHGNYVKYLENGREAFGKKFGIGYMDVYNNGYVTPIVDLHIRYMNMISYEEVLVVETTYVPCNSAKMIFDYTIYKESDMSVVLKASTIQLFMTRDGIFEVSAPDFYRKWKKQWNVQPE